MPWSCPSTCAVILAITGTVHAQVLSEVFAGGSPGSPGSPDEAHYVEVANPTPSTVDLGGFSLASDAMGPPAFVFPPATQVSPGACAVVWSATSLTGVLWQARLQLSDDRCTVVLRAPDGRTLESIALGLQDPGWSYGRLPGIPARWVPGRKTPGLPNQPALTAPQGSLRFNEWMARPISGPDWIELHNPSPWPVILDGLAVTDSQQLPTLATPFPPLSILGGGARLLLLANGVASSDPRMLPFRLAASGETLLLLGPDKFSVLDRITFGDQSAGEAEGRFPDGGDQVGRLLSGQETPGFSNSGSAGGIVVSEVLSHTDPPLEDAIELHNTANQPVDISGWWLSDHVRQPQKFRIPAGTTIPAKGYWVAYEYQFGAGAHGFTLDSAEGDEVVLWSPGPDGLPGKEKARAAFGPVRNGVTLGRVETTLGEDFVPLEFMTLGISNPGSLVEFRRGRGGPNAAPRSSPVMLAEVAAGNNYERPHFVEMHNPGNLAWPLYHPIWPTNRWRLRGHLSFDLPGGVTLPAGGHLLLVGFDPQADPDRLAAFRNAWHIPNEVPVLGPLLGTLPAGPWHIELQAPDSPESPGDPNAGHVPYELMERVSSRSSHPWPSATPANGLSLQRKATAPFSNEPRSWFAALPTPGRPGMEDADLDGLTDSWEITHALDPQSAADAEEDPDGDGINSAGEFLAGTRPGEAADYPQLRLAGWLSGRACLLFEVREHRRYSLQSRTRLLEGYWQEESTWTTADHAGFLQVLVPATQDQTRVYRLAIHRLEQ